VIDPKPIGATMVEPGSRSQANTSSPASTRPGTRPAIAVGLALLAAVHAPLLSPDPSRADIAHLEGLLFEPTSAAPIPVLLCWLWMIWARRERLAGFVGEERPNGGALLLLASGALAGWAHYTGVHSLLVLSLGLVTLASAWMLVGPRGFRTLIYPCTFLLLAMPVPTPIVNAILFPLQRANASVTGWLLGLFGMDARVSGDLIFTSFGTAQVIEGCTGVRSLLIVVMAACIYTELAWHDRRRTRVLIALSPVVAVVMNEVRILSVVFNPYGAFAAVHTAQGLVTIVASVLCIAGIDLLLGRIWKTPREPHLIVETPRGRVHPGTALGFAGVSLAIALASLAGPRWEPPQRLSIPNLTDLGGELPDFALAGFEPDFEYLGSARFDAFLAYRWAPRALDADRPEVRLLVGADHRLDPVLGIGSRKTAIPGRGGFPVSDTSVPSPAEGGVESLVVQQSEGRFLVYFWSRGQAGLGVETVRAVFGLDRSPWRRPGRAAFVRLATEIEPGTAGLVRAKERLDAFVASLLPEFEKTGVAPR